MQHHRHERRERKPSYTHGHGKRQRSRQRDGQRVGIASGVSRRRHSGWWRYCGHGKQILAGSGRAASHPAWLISERRIAGTFAATRDQIQTLVALEIKPLLEFAVLAIEREMLANDHQAETFEQGRTAHFEQVILYL